MQEFFKSKKFKVIVLILALVIGVMLYSANNIGNEGISGVIGTVFKPVQEFSTNLTEKVRSGLDMIINSKSNYEDNIKLKQMLNEYYKKVVDYETIKKENEQLRNVIGIIEDNPDYQITPPCTVIARTTNDPFGSFTIDRGSDDGIKELDPVITDNGLIGIVTSVSKTYCRVKTILSPEVPVGGFAVETNDTGVIEGDSVSAKSGLCKLKYIERDSNIAEGNIIVTSGNSGLFPVNIVIGTVQSVKEEDSGLSMTATIQPVEDILTINSVFVITSFNGQGEGYEE